MKEEEKAIRDKFALPEELQLVKEDEVRDEAKEEWAKSRREWQMEEDVRRKKFDSEFGRIPMNGASSNGQERANSHEGSRHTIMPRREDETLSGWSHNSSGKQLTSSLKKSSKVTSTLASSLIRNSLKRQGSLVPSVLTARGSASTKLVAKDIGIVKKW